MTLGAWKNIACSLQITITINPQISTWASYFCQF